MQGRSVKENVVAAGNVGAHLIDAEERPAESRTRLYPAATDLPASSIAAIQHPNRMRSRECRNDNTAGRAKRGQYDPRRRIEAVHGDEGKHRQEPHTERRKEHTETTTRLAAGVTENANSGWAERRHASTSPSGYSRIDLKTRGATRAVKTPPSMPPTEIQK